MKTALAAYLEHGQVVLEISASYSREVISWEDFQTIKTEEELRSALIRVRCCNGYGYMRPGLVRIVHRFMGKTTIVLQPNP